MTDAIQAAHDPLKQYHFSNENDMLNRLVVGMTAKQFKEAHGTDDVRPYMTPEQISLMARLQRTNTDLIQMGWDYARRKAHLTEMARLIQEPKLRLVSG